MRYEEISYPESEIIRYVMEMTKISELDLISPILVDLLLNWRVSY